VFCTTAFLMGRNIGLCCSGPCVRLTKEPSGYESEMVILSYTALQNVILFTIYCSVYLCYSVPLCTMLQFLCFYALAPYT